MTEPFVHRLQVRYVECDMQGIVFNAHYVTWMDIAHFAFFKHTVGPLEALHAEGFDFVVGEVNVRFLAGARFDQEIAVAVTLDPLGTTSMTSHHTISHEDTLLAEGRVRHVCVDRATYGKRAWPEHVRSAVAPFVA